MGRVSLLSATNHIRALVETVLMLTSGLLVLCIFAVQCYVTVAHASFPDSLYIAAAPLTCVSEQVICHISTVHVVCSFRYCSTYCQTSMLVLIGQFEINIIVRD